MNAAYFGAPPSTVASSIPSLAPPPVPGGSRPLQMPAGGPPSPGQCLALPGWLKQADERKVRWLRDYIRKYGSDPRMRYWVFHNVMGGDKNIQRDYGEQVRRILAWVQERITYVNEDGELFQSPWVTIREGIGDCDDLLILIGAMLTSFGLPWRIALGGVTRGSKKPARWLEPWPIRDNPGRTPRNVDFVHIYLVVGDKPFNPQNWVAAEPTIRGAPLGYDPVYHGPLPDSHMQGRWTGRLPELAGAQSLAGTPDQTAAEKFDAATFAKEVTRDGIKFGIAGLISAGVTALVMNAYKKSKRR